MLDVVDNIPGNLSDLTYNWRAGKDLKTSTSHKPSYFYYYNKMNLSNPKNCLLLS